MTKPATVEALLRLLPPDECEITEALREVILNCVPDVREKLSYGVPFYYGKSRMFFIWPASVLWGNLQEGVALGFCKGHLLIDEEGYLDMDGRKVVSRRIFLSVNEIDAEKLSSYIFQAAELDRAK